MAGRPTGLPGSRSIPGNTLEQYALNAGFSPAEAKIAAQVALAETGGDPLATHKNANGSTDYGAWQINSVHKDVLSMGNWQDPQTNARMAYAVYKQAGMHFTPWVTFTSGAYKKKTFFDTANPAGVNDVLPGASAVTSAVTSIPALIAKITDPALWARIGVGALGFFVLVVGLVLVLGKRVSGNIPGPVGAVTKAVL